MIWDRIRRKRKKFSILGDSISTLAGYNPEGYAVFYQGENCERSGVYEPLDTWWGKVIEYFGGELLVNDAYSGSRVSELPNHAYRTRSPDDFMVRFPSGISSRRVENLRKGRMKPDVIIIYMGTNDYGYGVPISCYRSDATMVSYENKYFDIAYETMLKAVCDRYPKTEIWCCTLCPGHVKGAAGSTFPYHLHGIPFAAYNQVILDVAEKYRCKVVDFSKYQFEYEAMDGTHPTAVGMSQIADVVKHEMLIQNTFWMR